MDDEARKAKNRIIKEKGRETRLRHASMRPVVIELKLDLKCLNNAERDKLFLYFAECRWLCNYLIGLESDKFKNFSTKTRGITSLDKDGKPVARSLMMPAKFIQAVYSSLKQDMSSLAAKRRKTGKKNGKLKFRSSYDSIELNDFRIDSYTDVISQFIEKHKPSAILFGATEKGRMLAPRIAARFRTGLTADCTALEMNPDSDIVQIRPAFGGNIMAEILTTRTRPQLCTARYKTFNAVHNISKKADIIRFNPSIPESGMTIIKVEKKPSVKDISDADAIIAVGRGLRSKDDMPMIEKLASLLSAEIAFSRPMIEAGWAEATRQIGLSGRTVKPKLIIAIGISGAIQFAAGMKESDFIIAVNTDRNAPITSFADCSIIGNLYEIIPALIRKIEEKNS